MTNYRAGSNPHHLPINLDFSFEKSGDLLKGSFEGKTFEFKIRRLASGSALLEFDGHLVEGHFQLDRNFVWIQVSGQTFVFEKASKNQKALEESSPLSSPMPGKVMEILVKAGDSVTKGQALLRLEAMKMETLIKAPRDSKVKKILTSLGSQVEPHKNLVELE